MSGFFQNLLQDAAKGFFGSEYLRDYTHASKTFRTNGYAYAPKYKFLFHVEFKINRELIGPTNIFPADSNFGLAVKTIQLPKFAMDLHGMNQYNRNRLVQTKIKYDPISISFHDDNANLIRQLWYTYYSYYYKDSSQMAPELGNPPSANSDLSNSCKKFDYNRRNTYEPSIDGNDDWGYIGEGANSQQTPMAATLGMSKPPFFKSIDVYGFNQHSYVLYRLINPMIESFNHDTYDYSATNGTMENQMSLRYETVKYFDGAIDGRTPDNIIKTFGTNEHYDRTLSPIARPGSQATILGQGGLIAAAGGFMEDLENGNILGAIQKAGAAKNTFKNPQNILKIAKGEILSGVAGAVQGTPNRNNTFLFPTFDPKAAVNAANSAFGALTKPPSVNNTRGE
jgi:hypothetical protein